LEPPGFLAPQAMGSRHISWPTPQTR
jgi:hypothetical protein